METSFPIEAKIIVGLLFIATLVIIYSLVQASSKKKLQRNKTIRLSRQQREVIERKRR